MPYSIQHSEFTEKVSSNIFTWIKKKREREKGKVRERDGQREAYVRETAAGLSCLRVRLRPANLGFCLRI